MTGFDQFEEHKKRNGGIDKSTYSFDNYSTRIDESKIDETIRKKAEYLEREIGKQGKGDEH